MPSFPPAMTVPHGDDAPAPGLHPSLAAATGAPGEPGDAEGWLRLGLQPALAAAALAAGWAGPTPVQAAVLPPLLQGQDVLVLAPTGSGKTGAFLLPLLQHLTGAAAAALAADAAAGPAASAQPRPAPPAGTRAHRLRALVLAPTRELAQQTGGWAGRLAPQLRCRVLVGGVSVNPQMMALRGGADLVVATPGRLLDLHARHALSLAEVSLLVLDEADRLLDLGFAEELQAVLAWLPRRRQQVLVSATLPPDLERLAQRLLHQPLRVDVRGSSAEAPASAQQPAPAAAAGQPAIVQRAIEVDAARRTPLLRHLVRTLGWRRTLVFVATQHAAEQVADKLRAAGLPAAALHGALSAGRRSQVLADLVSGHLAVLVATDLAARGLDLAALDAVVNHDLPRSAVDHLHRIGRTGRIAGADQLPRAGVALSFVCADRSGSEAHFRLIEKRQQQRVPREQVPGFEPAAPPLPADARPAGRVAAEGAGASGAAVSPSRADDPGQPPGAAAQPLDPHGGIKGARKSRKDRLREAAARAAAATGKIKA